MATKCREPCAEEDCSGACDRDEGHGGIHKDSECGHQWGVRVERRTRRGRREEVAGVIERTEREERTGDPDVAAALRAQDRQRLQEIYAGWDARSDVKAWLNGVVEVARHVCQSREEVTTDHWWPYVVFPDFDNGRGRIIGRAVTQVVRAGWMERWMLPDGSMRGYPSDTLPMVFSLDGVRIQHQKIVPIYRSLLYPHSAAPTGEVIY